MEKLYKIIVQDQEGNKVAEADAEGYVICAFNDSVEIEDGIKACKSVKVLANNVSDAEVAAVIACEDTPLGKGHKLLNEMAKKRRRLSDLFGKIGRKES